MKCPLVRLGLCSTTIMVALATNSQGQNGSVDAGFQAEVNNTVRAIATQQDGKILIAGNFTSVNGVPRNGVARLHSDGDLDLSFDPGLGADGSISTIVLQSDGRLLIAGEFYSFNGTNRGRIARLNSSGGLDISFNPGSGADGAVYSMAVQTNGQILIAGTFSSVNTSNRSGVARLNNNGSLDTNFATSAIDGSVRCLALQPNGRILIGGNFGHIGGTTRNGIARLRADGSLDISFFPEVGGTPINAVGVQPDGRILIGGNFFALNRRGISRMNSDGTRDPGFNVGAGVNSLSEEISCFVIQPDGKLIIGGTFTTVSSVPRTGIARLNPDGTLDSDFAPGLTDRPYVFSLALQPDGKALIGGDFTRVNGLTRVRIARLDKDSTGPAATLSVQMFAGLTLTGQTGLTYRIEYTGDLTNQTRWRTLTDLSLSNEVQFHLDTTSPFSNRRFYRAVTLP